MKSRVRWFYVVGLLTAIFVVSVPASAGAYIYWTGSGSIGRANNDGTAVNANLIGGAEGGSPLAANADHLYYTTDQEDEVGDLEEARTNLDGGESLLLPEAPIHEGNEVAAVDSDHVYWVNGDTIGRAKLDGTDREPEFLEGIGGEPAVGGIAVYEGFIYWADYDGGSGSAIGRANLSTKEITPDFIEWDEGTGPRGIAVGQDGIFWVNSSDNTIGRAAFLKGSAPNLDAIAGASVSGLGLAIDSSGLYWFNYQEGDATIALARAVFGGAGSASVDFHFINALGGVWLAVNSATTPPPPPPPGQTANPNPAPILSPILPKPLRCKKGFKKQRVKGKNRCVRIRHRHKPHAHH